MKKDLVYIYGLLRDGEIFYVGATKGIGGRIRLHRNRGKKFDSYKILKIVKVGESEYWENFYMDLHNTFRSGKDGCNLAKSDGGGDRYSSESTKDKIGKASKKQWESAEFKNKMSSVPVQF